MPTYSVVIPVYNAEKYLKSCVDSILAQNSSSKIEVILVNDGSKDGSPQICDCYARRNSSVKVIHQINQGVSVARNAGIAAANGKYILFLDADDDWDARFLQSLDRIIPQNPDVIEFGYRFFGGADTPEPVLPAVKASAMTGIEYFEAHKKINHMPIGSCWSAAFKRQFLKAHNIRFPVGVSYGEDFSFHMHCLRHAESVTAIAEPLYRYRMNEQGVTRNLSVKKMQDMLGACAEMYCLFPCAMLANYYCMKILNLARLSRSDAAQLKPLLRENRDILRHTSGRKMRVVRILYGIFGYDLASRLIQSCVRLRHGQKG